MTGEEAVGGAVEAISALQEKSTQNVVSVSTAASLLSLSDALERLKIQVERSVNVVEVLLQIAIVMGAVSIMSKARAPFYVSLLLALAGLLLALNAFTLLFSVPLLH